MSEKPKKKQLEEKVRILTKVLSKDPKSRLFVPLAVAYLDLEKPKEAEEVCRQGINHYRDYYQAYTVLALSLIRQNRNEEAKSALQETVGHTKGNIKATRLLSSLFEEDGRFDDAIETLQQILPYCTQEERDKLDDKIRLLKTAREQQKSALAELETDTDEVLDFLEGEGGSAQADANSADAAITPMSINDEPVAEDEEVQELPSAEGSYSDNELKQAEYENLGDQISDAELEAQQKEAEEQVSSTIDLEQEDGDFSSAFGADALMGDMDAPIDEEGEGDELSSLLADPDDEDILPTEPKEPDLAAMVQETSPEGDEDSELLTVDPESSGDDSDSSHSFVDDREQLLAEEEAAAARMELSAPPELPTDLPDEALSTESMPEDLLSELEGSQAAPPAVKSTDTVEKYLGIPDDIWSDSLMEVAQDMDDIIDLGREILDVKDISADENLYKEYAQSLEQGQDTQPDEGQGDAPQAIVIDDTSYIATATLARVFESQGYPAKALLVYRHMDTERYSQEIATLEQLIEKNEKDLKRYDLHRSMQAIETFHRKLQRAEQEGAN